MLKQWWYVCGGRFCGAAAVAGFAMVIVVIGADVAIKWWF